MKLQLSIEILIGMLVALLVAATLLRYLSAAHSLTAGVESSLSALANQSGSYPAGLLSG